MKVGDSNIPLKRYSQRYKKKLYIQLFFFLFLLLKMKDGDSNIPLKRYSQRYKKKLYIQLFFFLFLLLKMKDGDSNLGDSIYLGRGNPRRAGKSPKPPFGHGFDRF
jgi:hypothetical protein